MNQQSYRGTKEYLLIYCQLVTAARYRGLIPYREVIAIMKPLIQKGEHIGGAVGRLVGEISYDEIQHGRPMLSAIVVGKEGIPGPGFFEWARTLGKLNGTGKEAELAFWEAERAAIYDTWGF